MTITQHRYCWAGCWTPVRRSVGKLLRGLILSALLLGQQASSAQEATGETAQQAEYELSPLPGSKTITQSSPDAGAAIVLPALLESDVNITLDGKLDEPFWQSVPGYDRMTIIEPDKLVDPKYRTELRYFYTDKAFYVGVIADQPPETMLQRLSSRDDFFSRDSFSITLDTSGEGLYGYWFSVALGGALSDGKVAPERNFSREWDGPWDGATQKTDKGWTAEMRLPWSMMTMPAQQAARRMGVYYSRQVGHMDERWAFPALPTTGARFMSALQPIDLPGVKPRAQFDLYPFVSGTQEFARAETEGQAGLDVFWRPSTNLQLSATLNPDFGAVESDDVVINLTATEAFFPERRLFFLEGNEIFSTTPRSRPRGPTGSLTGSRRTSQLFNPEPTQIVNTRRIGGGPALDVPADVTIPGFEEARPSDLLGALKVTGQLGGLRYGALGAFEDDATRIGTRTQNGTAEDVELNADGRNYGVARVLYERADRGRRSVGYIGTYVDNPFYDAKVHGVDAHVLSANGKFAADLQLLHSDVNDVKGYGGLLDFAYTQRRGIRHQLQLDAFDSNLNINDLGFLRRNDNYGAAYRLDITNTNNLRWLRSRRTNVSMSYWENAAGEVTRTGLFLRNNYTFKNNFELRTEFDYFPKRRDDLESEGNGSYELTDRWVADIAFGTDTTKVFAVSGRAGARQEDLGGWTYSTAFGFTYKPNDRISVDLDLNYRYRQGWVLHQQNQDFTTFNADDFQPRLRLDMFLSARQQFSLSMQWAGIKAREDEFLELPVGGGKLFEVNRAATEPSDSFVVNRMTVQARYRWQIAPLSDLFVVYTRGSNVRSSLSDEYEDLFVDALKNPVIDVVVIKLRYRFGR